MRVGTKISFAHFIPGFHGAEGRVHGHDWKIEAVFGAHGLDGLGMLASPRDLLRLLNAAIADFQNVLLNDVPEAPVPPTPEKIAAFVLGRLRGFFEEFPPVRGFCILEVRVLAGDLEVTFS